MVAAACGDSSDAEADTADGESTQATTDNDGNGNGDGNGDSDAGGSSDDQDGDGSDSDSGDPDDDDFGEIIGNPDLDADDLPGAAGDLADSIDDFVSLGDCVAVGLMATPPEGWMCRVIDNPTPTFDGFTMFTEGNDLSITVGTPLPGLGSPCEILQACDDAVPIALSDNFPDTMPLEFAGTIVIYGTHATGAELAITKSSSLTEDETQLIMDVLDSVQPA